jgi:hypothetical protein
MHGQQNMKLFFFLFSRFLVSYLDKRRIAMILGRVSSLLFGVRSCVSQLSIFY